VSDVAPGLFRIMGKSRQKQGGVKVSRNLGPYGEVLHPIDGHLTYVA